MKALTVGGAMIDTIAIISDELIERMSMSNAGKTFLLLEQGSKTEASDISTHCGGGAMNAAVALVRLGAHVNVLAKVGHDERAQLVRKALSRENVSTVGLLTTPQAPTGASAIISAHDRNAAVFTFRGANTLLRAQDIDAQAFRTDLVYISTLSGDSALILPHLVEAARSGGGFLVVNPGIRQITTRFGLLREMLGSIDLLAVNRSEAEAFVREAVADLSGSENAQLRRLAAHCLHKALAGEPTARSDQARALVEGFMQLGARQLLLTDGRHGAYVGSSDGIRYCPSLPVTVVSTVGAGDAFVSTFSGLCRLGYDVPTALRGACVNAACVVMQPDTQAGLLPLKPLLERVAASIQDLPVSHWT